ncbi:MAG TPA: hypothetical protein VGI64_07050 [Streptosporangiaceae bacterium]
MVSVSVLISRPEESPPHIAASTVCNQRGTCVTVRGSELAGKVIPVLSATALAGLIQSVDEGVAVSFGPLRISRAGLADMAADPTAFSAWPEMREITFDARLRTSPSATSARSGSRPGCQRRLLRVAALSTRTEFESMSVT